MYLYVTVVIKWLPQPNDITDFQLQITSYQHLKHISYYCLFLITMNIRIIAFLLILLFCTNAQLTTNSTLLKQPCLQFQAGTCIQCPINYHQYQNECYQNITGCTQYTYLPIMSCTTCDQSISFYNGNGGCTVTVSLAQLAQIQYLALLSANYGDLRFLPITVSQARSDTYFQICDNYMRSGEYKHFISLSSEPVESVGTFVLNGSSQYKILYAGSGGGLMLCIIQINQTDKSIRLSALVTIGITNIVPQCSDYSSNIQCLRCASGYHLQNSVCYQDIPACNSYFQNICLSCSGFTLLVENRCISCSQMQDLGQIRFYGDFRLSQGNSLPLISRDYLIVA